LDGQFTLPCQSLSFCNTAKEKTLSSTSKMEYGEGETTVSLEQESSTAKNFEVEMCTCRADLVGAKI
jgi:hypothetical protein